MSDIKHLKAAFRQRQTPQGGAQGTKKGQRGYSRKRGKIEMRKRIAEDRH